MDAAGQTLTAPAERARRRPDPLHPSVAGLLGLGAALWGFIAASSVLGDNSFFTHLATGRLILESGAVPTEDPYSFTAPGAPWIVQSWLVSLVWGALDALAGPWAIRVAAGGIGAVAAAGVWALSRGARTLFSRLLVVVPALMTAGLFWSARPLLVGYLGIVLVLLSVQRRWSPLWMLPIMWVWGNSHGSFPLALVLLGAVALGNRLDGRDPRPELVRLGWAVGGVLLACVNPLGPRILLFPLDLVEKTDLLRNVVEWASPDFSQTGPRVFLVQLALAVVALVRRPAWRRVVPALVFIGLALLSLRNVPVASLVLVPAMAPGLAGIGDITGRERSGAVRIAAMGLALVFAGAVVGVARQPAFDFHTYPEAGTALLAAEGRLGGSARVLTSDVVGNYQTLLLGDDASVFLDDRYDMYPLAFLGNYLTVRGGGPGWQDVLDDCGIEAVLFERGQPLVQLLLDDPQWALELTDARFALLVRRDPPPAPNAACAGA